MMISRETNTISTSGEWTITYLIVPSHPSSLSLEYQKKKIIQV